LNLGEMQLLFQQQYFMINFLEHLSKKNVKILLEFNSLELYLQMIRILSVFLFFSILFMFSFYKKKTKQ